MRCSVVTFAELKLISSKRWFKDATKYLESGEEPAWLDGVPSVHNAGDTSISAETIRLGVELGLTMTFPTTTPRDTFVGYKRGQGNKRELVGLVRSEGELPRRRPREGRAHPLALSSQAVTGGEAVLS